MRSILLVPSDDASALERALRADADALVLDLGDDPASTRHAVRDFLRGTRMQLHQPLLYVRIAAIDTETIDDDLATIMGGEPDGIVLGRCRGGQDVQHLGAKLAVHEAEFGLTDGATAIIAEAGSAARSLFAMGSYIEASARLMALAWDPEALAIDLGAEHPRDADHAYTTPVATARSLTLLAARAASVAAIDGAGAGLQGAVFQAECEAARRDGFNCKVAVSAEQVAIINAVFDRAA